LGAGGAGFGTGFGGTGFGGAGFGGAGFGGAGFEPTGLDGAGLDDTAIAGESNSPAPVAQRLTALKLMSAKLRPKPAPCILFIASPRDRLHRNN
jgi:hypothetical protein